MSAGKGCDSPAILIHGNDKQLALDEPDICGVGSGTGRPEEMQEPRSPEFFPLVSACNCMTALLQTPFTFGLPEQKQPVSGLVA